MKCPTCDSTETEYDNTMGHLVCIQCGHVLEQDAMVTEVGFSETSKGAAIADGFNVKAGQAKSKNPFNGNSGIRNNQESSEVTREKGHAAIERAGNMQGINMGPNLIEKAKRVFDVALTARYTKGRKSNCVVAACCYITCRMEKTSHMMIDFADAFSTNVYQIGTVFLQLRNIFLGDRGNSTMPLVDPSLYMARFTDKLDFGEDTKKVCNDANRVAQRMSRDWMTTGRRPSGICAAARMNGYVRTPREIVLVVKICEGTLRKRLKEFQQTDSGKLSKTNFESIMLEQSADPPSFRNQKRKHGKQEEELEDLEDVDELLQETTQYIESSNFTNFNFQPMEESLSDLDDDPEVENALAMSDDEMEFKRELWTAENQDWIVKKEQEGPKPRKTEQRKRVKKDPDSLKGKTALESAKKLVDSKPQMSKKINYEVLNDLLNE
ncbi:transcription factor TFIIIB subunit brf1 [Boothiomyces macroporosus]|uniref:B-related factor 1 n=1 Tax=Boothiomyces macroporosus TaxID=261099 RepID=A0AAD5Y7I2_9FUNG|nr:transcription factor TFIIIB subunit brf1 [Boothiomyces macroporosus]